MPFIETVRGGGYYATPHTSYRGTKAEQRFADMCVDRGLHFRVATKKENIFNHFDFLVTLKDGRRQAVDVKAIKSRRRGGLPDPSVVFVEMRGVTGRPGWIYGKADYIAFEQPTGFFMVPRKGLLQRAEELLPMCARSMISGVAMTIYGRNGRRDEMLVLNAEHIHDISGSFFLTGR